MEFLEPIPNHIIEQLKINCSQRSIYYSTTFAAETIDNLANYHLAIIGVCDDRLRSNFAGSAKAADAIRLEFYQLIKHRNDLQMIDLGNIVSGNTISGTYFALKQTIATLLKQKVLCLIIGASEDFIYQQYAAYEETHFNMNVFIADARVALKYDDNNELQSG